MVATEGEETTSRTKTSIQALDSVETVFRLVNNMTNLSSPKEDEEEINRLTEAEEINLLTDEEEINLVTDGKGEGKEHVGDVKVRCI